MADNSTEIIQLTEANVVTFLHTSKGVSLGKPFQKQIFLLEVHIAGTTFLEVDLHELEATLKERDRLNFFRETDNPHDHLAIVVKNQSGTKLGYVPRADNQILARLMDAGKLIYGLIKEKTFKGKWLKIDMEIYLDD
jgi:hypothetical protein